ncbi:MAG: hypothetical protein ABI041_16935 [Bdellovibrionia bacterium]
MKHLSKSELNELSFPDTEVSDFQLDASERICKISCIDGLLGKSPKGIILNNIAIEIKDYHSLIISEFIENHTLVNDFSQEFSLKDICEFNLKESSVTLKGFSKIRGFWTEYVFTGGSLDVAYENAEKCI